MNTMADEELAVAAADNLHPLPKQLSVTSSRFGMFSRLIHHCCPIFDISLTHTFWTYSYASVLWIVICAHKLADMIGKGHLTSAEQRARDMVEDGSGHIAPSAAVDMVQRQDSMEKRLKFQNYVGAILALGIIAMVWR